MQLWAVVRVGRLYTEGFTRLKGRKESIEKILSLGYSPILNKHEIMVGLQSIRANRERCSPLYCIEVLNYTVHPPISGCH